MYMGTSYIATRKPSGICASSKLMFHELDVAPWLTLTEEQSLTGCIR
jgi:hypothetical protein